MKNKKNSFMDHLEYYFNIYLPTVKGLSKSTIVSYKAMFRYSYTPHSMRHTTATSLERKK